MHFFLLVVIDFVSVINHYHMNACIFSNTPAKTLIISDVERCSGYDTIQHLMLRLYCLRSEECEAPFYCH